MVMGFKDILKKLIPGDINLVKIVVDNSKNTIIENPVLIVNSKIGERREYTLPNTVKYEDVKGNVDKLYKKDISGFVRKDLALPEVGMMAARQKRKKIFKFYKEKILPEHYQAMICAYTIMEFEDAGDGKSANELFDKFVRRFPNCGRHVYNFCRSGLIEGKFWTELGMIIFQGASPDIVRDKFASIFTSYVEFYPHAVWVAPPMNLEAVGREIRVRINRKEIIRLDIYIRGKEKIKLIEDDLVYLIDHKKGLSIEEISRYFIGNTPCVRITLLKNTKTFKTF